jgi:TonB-dependent SusC/RagA subfamily outer membrane receptor
MKLRSIIIVFLSCFSIFVYGQKVEKNISVTGMVINTDQKPVEGAAIYIDNKITRSLTDNKGFYKVRIKQGAKQIKVSSKIYGDSATEIKGRTKIDFTLIGKGKMLSSASDSLVFKGKLTLKERASNKRKQNSSTGSEAKSKNYFLYRDIFEMIQAENTGVQVIGTKVIIQGTATFGAGSNEALYIVDGTPVSQISYIPPGDVNSIKLIKGPEAAFYGIKGGNGVVVITTKRGGDKK